MSVSFHFPIVSSDFQPGSGGRPKVFVVSLDWTRPKRNDGQASHAFPLLLGLSDGFLLKST